MKLIDLQETENERAATISTMLISFMEKHNVASKCIAFGGDNCNTNFDGASRKSDGNNVYAHLKDSIERAEKLIGVGCPAHIIHNANSTWIGCFGC